MPAAMLSVALKMLFGDKVKYLGLVFGVAFATLLITQQSGVFVSLMARTASVILDAEEVNIWVMDPGVEYIDTVRPLRDGDLPRVRGVEGVAWAAPMFKANGLLRTANGRISTASIIGVDDATFIGMPRRFVLGDADTLRGPDAVALDVLGHDLIWPGQPLQIGQIVELNDRRAVVAAIVDSQPAFATTPVIYARYSSAIQFVPAGRNQMSFVLARSDTGQQPETVARRITRETGLQALSSSEFQWKTIMWTINNTGIPTNFGVVIVLGVIVGVAIVGLTFNMFIMENMKQYAALKAIGVTNGQIVSMVLLQAAVIGVVGYSIGLGLASLFFETAAKNAPSLKGFWLPWEIASAVAVIAAAIMILATLIGLRRVLVVDPAVVFRG
jgi:putative ABC transport system permease protein